MSSMDKGASLSSQQLPSIIQQQLNKTSTRTPLSITHSQQTVVKKTICSKSLIYPFMAWFLFIILTMLYFIFV
jgi:hypothetical protein